MKRGIERLSKIHTPHNIWANLGKCAACWKCIDACPKQIIGKVGFLWHKHILFKHSENCSGCKKCIKTCPYGVFTDNLPDELRSMIAKKVADFR